MKQGDNKKEYLINLFTHDANQRRSIFVSVSMSPTLITSTILRTLTTASQMFDLRHDPEWTDCLFLLKIITVVLAYSLRPLGVHKHNRILAHLSQSVWLPSEFRIVLFEIIL